MTYTEELCSLLLSRLERARQLPVHLAVEYSALVNFWLDEIRHCLNVLDDYPERIATMRDAQRPFLRQLGRAGSPFRRGLSDSRRSELRTSLVNASRSLLARLVKDKLISDDDIRRATLLLDIDFGQF